MNENSTACKANIEIEKDARIADYEAQIKNYKLKIKELLKELRVCQARLKDEQSKFVTQILLKEHL